MAVKRTPSERQVLSGSMRAGIDRVCEDNMVVINMHSKIDVKRTKPKI
jgi:hypothetical protein